MSLKQQESVIARCDEISWTWIDVFRINKNLIQQLSAMFTCRDRKGGELSNQVSKMLYSPPGTVNIASYKESLDRSECWKLFVQLRNYTNSQFSKPCVLKRCETHLKDNKHKSLHFARKYARIFVLVLSRSSQFFHERTDNVHIFAQNGGYCL